MTSHTLIPFSGGRPFLQTPTTETIDEPRALTLFELPRRARDKIYRHVLHDDALEDQWSDEAVSTHVPNAHLGLLCASRRVCEEASAIMYSTVRLGSFAPKAAEYLTFIGPERIRQIRTLVLCYQCLQGCRTSYAFDEGLNWAPVFDILYQAWACVRRVEVRFDKCNPRWKGFFANYSARSQSRLAGECRLIREAKKDTFFSGLRSFVLAERIDFVDPVPEFFVYHLARDLGWNMKGTVLGDYRDSRQPNTEYRGTVVNPKFPLHFDRTLKVHQLIQQGFDVSGLVSSWEYYHRRDSSSATNPVTPDTTRRKKHFFDLPPEARQIIYGFVCHWEERAFWPDRPRRWNSGVDLLQTCKRIAHEALPAVYRNFRIYGYSTIETLDRLGPLVSHIQRLELHFSCFCRFDLDMDGVKRTIVGREIGHSAFHNPHGPLPVCSVLYRRYRDMWQEAMTRLRAQPKLKEIEVTFASCCRYRPRLYAEDRIDQATIKRQEYCCALEDDFLDLLARCHHVERLALVGDVPPSFALRISRRVAPGPQLRLKWISSSMRGFLEHAEAERTQWETNKNASEALWNTSKPTWYPDTPYPTTNPATHFVLVAEGTAKAKLDRALGLDKMCEGGMELVAGGVPDKKWQDVRELMDYGNKRLSDKYWFLT